MNFSISSSDEVRPQARRFLRGFAWTACVLLGGVAAVNLWIDPYYRFGTNWIGVYISAEREYKATAATHYPHDALIVGNSKPSIIDPAQIREYRFLNAGFAGAKPEEILAFLERYAHGQRLVVLGLDYGMFNEGAEPLRPDPFERPFWPDLCRYLLNAKSFQYSVEAVTRRLIGKEPTILTTGQSNPKPYLDLEVGLTEEHYEPALKLLRDQTFQNFRYSEARIAVLREIRDLLKARGIPVVAFVNPENDAVLDLIRGMPAGAEFARWKADMRAIFPDLVDLTEVSALSEHENYFLHDPYHYLPVTGIRIMEDHILPVARQGG